jgi:hypothetical protein
MNDRNGHTIAAEDHRDADPGHNLQLRQGKIPYLCHLRSAGAFAPGRLPDEKPDRQSNAQIHPGHDQVGGLPAVFTDRLADKERNYTLAEGSARCGEPQRQPGIPAKPEADVGKQRGCHHGIAKGTKQKIEPIELNQRGLPTQHEQSKGHHQRRHHAKPAGPKAVRDIAPEDPKQGRRKRDGGIAESRFTATPAELRCKGLEKYRHGPQSTKG